MFTDGRWRVWSRPENDEWCTYVGDEVGARKTMRWLTNVLADVVYILRDGADNVIETFDCSR